MTTSEHYLRIAADKFSDFNGAEITGEDSFNLFLQNYWSGVFECPIFSGGAITADGDLAVRMLVWEDSMGGTLYGANDTKTVNTILNISLMIKSHFPLAQTWRSWVAYRAALIYTIERAFAQGELNFPSGYVLEGWNIAYRVDDSQEDSFDDFVRLTAIQNKKILVTVNISAVVQGDFYGY